MTKLMTQLDDYKAQFKAKVPAETADLFQKKTVELAQSGITDKALKIGDLVPQFSLSNAEGKEFSLASVLANGPVVISFYRGAWCPYCNIELRELQKVLPQIKELGAELITISPQTPDKSLSSKEKHELDFEVLSDIGNNVAKEFGLVFTLNEELQPIYKELGIDIPEHNGESSFELPLAATYVVDRNGIVKYAFVDADYTQRAEPLEVIAALQELI